jgi:hypothetical protein
VCHRLEWEAWDEAWGLGAGRSGKALCRRSGTGSGSFLPQWHRPIVGGDEGSGAVDRRQPGGDEVGVGEGGGEGDQRD